MSVTIFCDLGDVTQKSITEHVSLMRQNLKENNYYLNNDLKNKIEKDDPIVILTSIDRCISFIQKEPTSEEQLTHFVDLIMTTFGYYVTLLDGWSWQISYESNTVPLYQTDEFEPIGAGRLILVKNVTGPICIINIMKFIENTIAEHKYKGRISRMYLNISNNCFENFKKMKLNSLIKIRSRLYTREITS